MPEPELVLDRVLEVLEDSTLGLRELTQQQYFELIVNALKTEENLSLAILERISAICVQILKGDVRHSALGLNIIATILRRVQKPLPKLLPMAQAVADFLQASASLSKASGLQTIAFNTLMAFPDDVLISLTYYEVIWEILNSYCHPAVVNNHPIEIQLQPFYIVSRLLRILDPQKKAAFVNEGLAVCFSTVIPCVMNVCQTHIITSSYVQTFLEVLEMLTEELIKIDYVDNAEWQTVLESIYSPNLYPSAMKSLLTSGCEYWHRLWIIFLKLLKTQITMNKAGVGSPINSMLPVVEMAFKMDVANRCKAFECWKHLIDNFSMETNEQFVNKRIRLLIIPLRSNNAKIEETALAKLDTWLHLIRHYENRMDDRILYPFLEFCFGKHDVENIVVIPGLISPKIKRISVKAFVELVGHVNCSGCGLEPRLKSKLISGNVLVNHWNEWLHCLKMAIRISAERDVDLKTDTITCVWKSFVMTVAELPENNIRKDLFNELLTMIKHLAKDFPSAKMADIVINTLTSSLFDETIKPLLQIKEWQNGPLKQLVHLLIDPALFKNCTKVNKEGLLKTMNLITAVLANECPKSIDHYVEWLLTDLVPNDPTLHLWTALAEAIQITKPKCETLICNFLLWPLKHMHMFTDMDCSAMVWYTNYIVLFISLDKTALVKETTRILLEHERSSDITSYFRLCVMLALIKAKTQRQNYKLLNEEVTLLMTITSKINDYNEFKQAFPILIDTINLMLSFILPLDITYLKSIVGIVRLVLRVLNKYLKQDVCTRQITNISGQKTFDNVSQLLNVIKAIQPFLQNKEGMEFKVPIIDELLEFRSLCNISHKIVDSILNSIINHESIDSALREKIKKVIEKPQDGHNSREGAVSEVHFKTIKPVESKFTKPVKKSTKKNEASIVNTVVENGEEFAVIKSNWKFNPRKLTENQKEKFQRKREDIPALYQDLSQSQDEFKLKSWKTDSQDASSTNSRSTSIPPTEEVSVILKNIPATNVVPKIIDNFFSESRKTNSGDTLDNEKTDTPDSIVAKSTPVIKTPRMALKDRVFRNVRNLIEKSTVTKEGNQNLNLLNETVSADVFNTPIGKCNDMKNIVHSAPSNISAERPARSKRKPKKFDDSEEYLLKKRRSSSGQYESPSPENSNDFNVASFPSQSFEHLTDKSGKKSDVVTELQSVEDNKMPTANESQATIEVDKPDSDPQSQTSKVVEVSSTAENDTVNKKDGKEEANQKLDEVINCSVSDVSQSLSKVVEVSSTAENDAVNKKDGKEEANQKLDEVINCSVSDVSHDNSVEEQTQSINLKLNTPNHTKSSPKSTSKKKDSDDVKSSAKKKSRIEKELAIDMVEGHPFLKFQSEKRVTRKCLASTPNGTRRKSITEKLNKLKTDPKSVTKLKKDTSKSIPKEKSLEISKDLSITVCETQDVCPDATQDLSEDIIESSQDSMATVSVKSFKNNAKKSVSVEKVNKPIEETQNLIGNVTQDINTTAEENNDDTDFPANKTDIQDNVVVLTEEMDTEPTDEKNTCSGEVVVVNDEDIPVIELNTEDPLPGPDTLELANADTLPTEPSQFDNNAYSTIQTCQNKDTSDNIQKESIVDDQMSSVADDITITLSDITQNEETGNASSPSKDDDQRKKDFLNNTLEISPIKSLSPIVPKSPSPETSSDFLIVKLSDPVQINGEPMEVSNSPEIFTEEKISPDKRDQSPPRVELVSSNNSPSSSLSLKKNRPQVRGGGRAAQMLGLCVPDRLHNIINKDKPEVDEPKKSSPVITPARRNLRMLYNTAVDNENSDENEDIENFLKFKRTVPTADCSPSGPILKRKLADIADEATVSPANKRKRVSFHDPVFTSVSVQKYIETSGVRSPQSSALKRLERQIRNQSHMKSPKRLDHLFKLDTVLTKAIESFTDSDLTSNDTQLSSLEPTPAVEVVKTSELNDTDPIFPDLVDCKDSINNVATELSSPGMRLLLVKELEGKIETVGDLAKLTELEINRLCIKAPKLQVVKKVLGDYASKKSEVTTMENVAKLRVVTEAPAVYVAKPCVVMEAPAVSNNVEVQTNVVTSETETQTSLVLQRLTSTQTDEVMTMQKVVQTDESGSKSTEDIIKSCLKDRKDFVSKLDEHLEEGSKRKLAEALPVIDCIDLLVKKMTSSDASVILNQVIQRESELHENGRSGNKELSFLLNHLCNKYSANDLILFCSQMLQNIHGKSV